MNESKDELRQLLWTQFVTLNSIIDQLSNSLKSRNGVGLESGVKDAISSLSRQTHRIEPLFYKQIDSAECKIHDYRPIKGLGYLRKDGTTVVRLRCKRCLHTVVEDRLKRPELDQYMQAIFIALRLEGLRISDLKILFPAETTDLYYWWRKCKRTRIKDLLSLRLQNYGTSESERTGTTLFRPGRTYKFSLQEHSKPFSSIEDLQLDFSVTFDPVKCPHFKEVRAIQCLLMGMSRSELFDRFRFKRKKDLETLLRSRLGEFEPLPRSPDLRIKKCKRDWSKPISYSLRITTELNPHMDTPLIVSGTYAKKKEPKRTSLS